MRVYIEVQAKPRKGESEDDLRQRIDHLLCFGTVKDAFGDAGIDFEEIQVVDRAGVEAALIEALRPFATYADTYPPDRGEDRDVIHGREITEDGKLISRRMTVGDVREAARVLNLAVEGAAAVIAAEARAGLRILAFVGPHDLSPEEMRDFVALMAKLDAIAGNER